MRAALIACAVFWLIVGAVILAWIRHDVNQTCGNDTSCRVQMEAP